MTLGRKKWHLFVLFLLMLFNSWAIVAPVASADTPTAALELSLPNDLTDWILDENAGYIYAISSTSNNLYFIRLSDLKIEKTLNIGSNPYSLARDGQSLQIALSGATMIKTVNLATQQISDTIITSTIPYSVAASSNYLFYGSRDGKIYKYNKVTRTSSLLFSNFISNDLALSFDESTNTLYFGNVSSYGGITAINADTGAKLSKDIDDDMEIGGPSLSLKHIFIDDQSVYFGGHQFNKANLLETTGTYSRTNNDYTYLESVILGVTDAYVLTTKGVYDKNTYTPLVLFPSNKRFALLDSQGHAYLAGIENWFTDANKITRIDLSIPPRITANFTTDAYSIRSDQAIKDWATTDNLPYIYAITASTNELVIIRKNDMSLVKKMIIGSNPSEIKILNNKVYIIFNGENHIKVMDINDGILTEANSSKITTKNYPLHVYPDNNNRILYNGGAFAGGISVTSSVYTSVTDTVYEKNTGIWTPDTYTLDPNRNILYGGDGSSLYKYNSQNFNLIERRNLNNSSNYYNIFLDDNYLYYGNRRYDATVTSTVYGTYPESVIYARGSYVFSNSAIYDRDSFKNTYNLLTFITHAYVDTDHSIIVSSENRLYKFNNIEEMQRVMTENRLPSNAVFVDEDLTSDRIDGYLTFDPPTDQDGLKGYSAYYLDQNGNKLQQIGLYKNAELSTDSRFVYEITYSTLPSGAVNIGLYPVVSVTNGIDRMLDVHLSVPIYDAPNYLPVDMSLTDMNPDPNKFAGVVTWKPGTAELPNARYYLYFINEHGPIGDKIVVVNGGQKVYSVTISEKDVPTEALGIGLFMENDDFASPFYNRKLLEDKRTPAIPSSSITVHKYMVQADNIVVNNLAPGDIIRVYNEGQTAIIGGGIVAPSQNSIIVTIGNLGNPGDKLLITRQTSNRGESTGTLVVVPPLTNDNNGVGGIGGGGAGGGFGGGGGGGGGGGSTSRPYTDPNGKMTYEVQPGHVDMLIALSTDAKELVLDATAKQHLDITTVSFDGDIVNKAALKGKAIVIKANEVQLKFPINAIPVANENNMVKFKVSSEAAPVLSNFNAVSSVLEFTLAEKDSKITNFNTPIEATFHYDLSKVKDASNLGVYWLDETTNTWTSIGGKVNGDGTITANVPHFSKYAVLEKTGNAPTSSTDAKTFDDIQGHWAQKDIEELVSKQIIDGMSDQLFQPNLEMNRAQLVTILMKAMKLQDPNMSKSFDDVASDAWYKDAVYAAYNAQIVSGVTDNSFAPNANVTREQLAVMIVNAYLNVTGKKLSDVEPAQVPGYVDAITISDWAKPYVSAATALGLLNGVDDSHFAPMEQSTRAQVAAVMVRMLGMLAEDK
ncbi:S-layer homology domain-containing protein [Paenibacillus sp. P36]|uniref:S-layer homology domain-containing protein n=1 Tax=Paenibacillus sp. P36 TaxID=3342538 RepID=UPI0038B2A06D